MSTEQMPVTIWVQENRYRGTMTATTEPVMDVGNVSYTLTSTIPDHAALIEQRDKLAAQYTDACRVIDKIATERDELMAEVGRKQAALLRQAGAGRTIQQTTAMIAQNENERLRRVDRSEYTSAASLEIERQANSLLTDELDRMRSELERKDAALWPFAFLDDDEPDTTQHAWEMRYQDRFQDWISFEDIAAARAALSPADWKGGE